MRHYVAMSIYLSIAFALVMTIGFSIANEPILRMMNYSDEIMPAVKGYMGIIYMGLLVTVAYDALSAFFTCLRRFPFPTVLPHDFRRDQCNIRHRIYRSNRNGRRRMRLCHSNRTGSLRLLMLYLHLQKAFRFFACKKEDFRISLKSLENLRLGIPMALQFSITAIGTIIVQGAINIYGENCMAGFSAAGKLQNIFMTVFVAFGATIATYVGQNRGAGKMERVKQGVRCTQYMIWAWSIIDMIAMIFLRENT